MYKGYQIVLENEGWFVYKDGYACGPFLIEIEAMQHIDWLER
jgi:hypothetical protein